MDILFVVFVLICLGIIFNTPSKPGCLYVLAFPLAILTLPFRLAADMMGGKKRRR